MKNKEIGSLPPIEILPNVEDVITNLLDKGIKLTAPNYAKMFNMSTAGLEKKLKGLENRGLLKSSLERVRTGVTVKTMRVYQRT